METPGTMLKREREARGISLKEISSITRIPVSALQNLEADRFDQFPAEVFAKGFLRNYARELQISHEEVMLAYQAHRQHRRRQELVEPPPIREMLPPPRPISDTVSPLVLTNKDGEREVGPSPVDAAPRTFRFAYLIVFLVVATSLGLSVLFTGTGEAEENDKRRVRPVVETDADKGSPWLMTDQTLTATKPAPVETPAPAADDMDFAEESLDEVEMDVEADVEPPAAEPAPARKIAPAPTPNAIAAPAPVGDMWNRPAFPADDAGR